mmetsp:Transcript_13855/g.12561  ORF Transcript_13855/g.12561 Transcript_13855/m.12561 type:complete len:123 (-) Transcript_13855:82-450(-)
MSDTLGNGQTLEQGSFLRSSNGKYYAVIQSDGNFVLYTSKDFVPSNAAWSTKTNGKGTGPYKITVQDDGNLVIYDNNNEAIWATNTNGIGSKPYRLEMQDDRNLVIYDVNGHSTWASGTDIK